MHLRRFLARRFSGAAGLTLSACRPTRGEPDLRDVMADLHGRGATPALPVVEVKAAPVVFRRRMPGMARVRGDWTIPVPPPDAETPAPDIALAPSVGWDGAGFRPGHGGGDRDRTLAALSPRTFTIGIGPQSARRATILPQPLDIALDVILTGAGVQFHREDP